MARRPHLVVAAAVGLVAVLVVVAVILSATRRAPTYQPGTPVAVVQTYLAAVIDGDHGTAVAQLSSDSPCTVDDFDRSYLPQGVRVVLRDSRIDGDTAQVRVDVITSTGGPFDTSEYSEKVTLRLTRASGAWLITGSPWPMYQCGKGA
ncbi:MAG: hypothetical protein M0Z51_11945 [Propionibacterium sp.]|nr:hypothetical protein [Propionibacterium sp.]